MTRARWYVRVIREKRKEIVISSTLTLTLALCTALWHYITGVTFHWESISPIEAPSFLVRAFYSALVFVTLGAGLYNLGFYKFLYSLHRRTRNGYRDYKEAKRVIWVLLIFLMFFVIVPAVVSILNAIISFFYNVFVLLLYIAPPLGISLLIVGAGYYVLKRRAES